MIIDMEALYTLSDNKGIYISKGKKYRIEQTDFQSYSLTDNFNNKITITDEEIRYRFKAV